MEHLKIKSLNYAGESANYKIILEEGKKMRTYEEWQKDAKSIEQEMENFIACCWKTKIEFRRIR